MKIKVMPCVKWFFGMLLVMDMITKFAQVYTSLTSNIVIREC